MIKIHPSSILALVLPFLMITSCKKKEQPLPDIPAPVPNRLFEPDHNHYPGDIAYAPFFVHVTSISDESLKIEWKSTKSGNLHSIFRTELPITETGGYSLLDSNISGEEYIDNGLSSSLQYGYKIMVSNNSEGSSTTEFKVSSSASYTLKKKINEIYGVGFEMSKDKKYFALLSNGNSRVSVWDASTYTKICSKDFSDNSCLDIDFYFGQDKIAVLVENTIKIIDFKNCSIVKEISLANEGAKYLALNYNNTGVIASSSSGSVFYNMDGVEKWRQTSSLEPVGAYYLENYHDYLVCYKGALFSLDTATGMQIEHAELPEFRKKPILDSDEKYLIGIGSENSLCRLSSPFSFDSYESGAVSIDFMDNSEFVFAQNNHITIMKDWLSSSGITRFSVGPDRLEEARFSSLNKDIICRTATEMSIFTPSKGPIWHLKE